MATPNKSGILPCTYGAWCQPPVVQQQPQLLQPFVYGAWRQQPPLLQQQQQQQLSTTGAWAQPPRLQQAPHVQQLSTGGVALSQRQPSPPHSSSSRQNMAKLMIHCDVCK
uniref:Uncharacterized protein n=1 Tax=Oryza meridionalis TaxID=40149 RepID=A0A0E0CVX0_9ORYZ